MTAGSGRKWIFGLIVFGVGLYLLFFLTTPFEPYSFSDGPIWPRGLFFSYLLVPEDYFSAWTGPTGISLGDRLPILGHTLLALLVACGWGNFVLRLRKHRFDPLETVVFSIVIGLGLLSTLLSAWSFVNPFGRDGLLYGCFLFMAIGLFGAIGHAVRTVRLRLQSKKFPQGTVTRARLWSFGVALPLLTILLLMGGMIPSTDYDVLSYHLAGAREFAEAGRIGFLPHNAYANMPFGAEMFVVWGILPTSDPFSGAMVGKTIIALTTLLTALGLYTFGRRFFSEPTGLVAMLLYASTPWILYVSTAGLIDSVVGMYAFFALYALFLQEDRSGAALAGFFAGSAAACKYPAVLFVIVPIALFYLVQSLRGERRGPIPLLVFLVAACFACGGWYLKNLWYTGNPFYPLCFSIFGDTTGSWNAAIDARWNSVHRPHGFGPAVLLHDFWRVLMSSPWNGPLAIPFCLLAFGNRDARVRRDILKIFLAWTLFLFACWWLLTHRIDRFWLPALPAICLLAGVGACWNRGRFWTVFLVLLLSVGTVYGILAGGAAAPGKINRYLASLDSMRKDPNTTTPWSAWLNEHPPEGTLLLVGEAKAFLYEIPILYSTCFNETPLKEILEEPDPAEALRSRNISMILVDWGEIRRFRSPGNYGFSEFVQPERFDRLVAEGLLRRYCPTEELEQTSTVVYQVLGP